LGLLAGLAAAVAAVVAVVALTNNDEPNSPA
jgi:hypothetical protein